MKRSDLEKYLGKKVRVTFFDGETEEGETCTGELHKTGEEQFKNNSNLYISQKYYFLINPQSFLFKCSHVKEIQIIGGKK
ncbi:MAG: hypothetical protein Q4F95_07360 [Oscillospiraceae bacterium]|nr:hypothetical protein [Oscillospiraceae bacterium]